MFTKQQRPTGDYWQHDKAPVFISKYEALKDVRGIYFKAYKSIERVPAGRAPYSVDNRAIGPARGFDSLEAAMAYCEEHVGEVAA